MKRPISMSVIALFFLAGCAAIRIDVDVYKGPLANHEDVQIQQLITLADGAKPLLVTLRDDLQYEADHNEFPSLVKKRDAPPIAGPENVSDWRQKQAWYQADFVGSGQCNIQAQIEEFKDRKASATKQLERHVKSKADFELLADRAEKELEVIVTQFQSRQRELDEANQIRRNLRFERDSWLRKDDSIDSFNSILADLTKQLESADALLAQLNVGVGTLRSERLDAESKWQQTKGSYADKLADLNSQIQRDDAGIKRLTKKLKTTISHLRQGGSGDANSESADLGSADQYSCFSDERAFRVNMILGLFYYENPLKAPSYYDEPGNSDGLLPDELGSPPYTMQPMYGVGLAPISKAYKLCLNRPVSQIAEPLKGSGLISSGSQPPQGSRPLPCKAERKEYLKERLLRAYVGFGERLLVLANSEALQSRAGIFERFSGKAILQQRVDRYAAFLQSIGNSIQVAADELIHKADFDETSKHRVQSELGAQRAATVKNAIEVIDDVLTDLRLREVKGSKDVLDAKAKLSGLQSAVDKSTDENAAALKTYEAELEISTPSTEGVALWPAKFALLAEAFWNGKCEKDMVPGIDCMALESFVKLGLEMRAYLKNKFASQSAVELTGISNEIEEWLKTRASNEADKESRAAIVATSAFIKALIVDVKVVSTTSSNTYDITESILSTKLINEMKNKAKLLAKTLDVVKVTKSALEKGKDALAKNRVILQKLTDFTRALKVLPGKKKELLAKASELGLLNEPTAFFGVIRDVVQGEVDKAEQQLKSREQTSGASTDDLNSAKEMVENWNSAKRVMLEINAPPTTSKRVLDLQCGTCNGVNCANNETKSGKDDQAKPCPIAGSEPAGFQKQIDVLDSLIGMLRYELIEAKKTQGEGGRVGNIELALREAYEQRSGLTYLRPATTYLRSISSATVIQESNSSGNDNMLVENQMRLLPDWLRLAPDSHKAQIREELDKQFWHNINRVALSGGGDANYVIAKDDVGNWYVKAYATDASQVYRSAANLGMFALGGKIDVNLLDRLDEERQLKKQIEAKDNVTEARSRLDKLRSEKPATVSSPLGKVFTSYKDSYIKKSDESLKLLAAEILQDDKLKQRIQTAWVATLKDSTIKIGDKPLLDLLGTKLSARHQSITNEATLLQGQFKNIQESANALQGGFVSLMKWRDDLNREVDGLLKSQFDALAKKQIEQQGIVASRQKDLDAVTSALIEATALNSDIKDTDDSSSVINDHLKKLTSRKKAREDSLNSAMADLAPTSKELTEHANALKQLKADVMREINGIVSRLASSQLRAASDLETAGNFVGQATGK